MEGMGANETFCAVYQKHLLQWHFCVVKDGVASARKNQAAGISQGCPLSPFLFIMLMTVVVSDAVEELDAEATKAFADGRLAVQLYADDTLILADCSAHAQELLDGIARVGSRFGLSLHPDKFQLLRMNCSDKLVGPDGREIQSSDKIVYLGATLHETGDIKSELSKKFGQAWADFSQMLRLWNHSSVSLRRRIEIFQSFITSRLLYGLSSAWLNAAELRRLDGFQARCLRKILRVPSAFFSRVSNKDVLQRSQQYPYSSQLLRQQLILFGKVARAEDTDVLRCITFCPSSLHPLLDKYVRKVGRPKHEWPKMLLKEAVVMAGSLHYVETLIRDPIRWKARVFQHTSVHA